MECASVECNRDIFAVMVVHPEPLRIIGIRGVSTTAENRVSVEYLGWVAMIFERFPRQMLRMVGTVMFLSFHACPLPSYADRKGATE